MASSTNKQLYSVLDVLRSDNNPLGATKGQLWWVSRDRLTGMDPIPDQLYGYPRPNADKMNFRTLTVPGTTQTNTIRVALDGGAHIAEWDLTVSSVTRQILNHQGSYGRSIQNAFFLRENYEPIQVVSVSKSNPCRIVVRFPHGVEAGKKFNVTVAGCNGAGDIDIDAAYSDAIPNPATAADTGSDYLRAFTIPVNTTDSTDTYALGTAMLTVIHNPTQAGSQYSLDPANSAAAGDNDSVNNGYAQGSPVLGLKMELIGSNQGYIETLVAPCEWGPDDSTTGIYHGGSKYHPVVWHGMLMRTRLWINYLGNEGIHKWTCDLILASPLELGAATGQLQFVAHLRRGLGAASGDAVFRCNPIATAGPFTTTSVNLNATDWPGTEAGNYIDPNVGNALITGVLGAYRSATGVADLVDPSPLTPNLGANVGGCLASVSDPTSAIFCGFWGASVVNPTQSSFVWSPAGTGSGYGVLSPDTIQLSSYHTIANTTGGTQIPAGTTSYTSWFLTGAVGSIGSHASGMIKTMLDNQWF